MDNGSYNDSYSNVTVDCDEFYQFNTLSSVYFQTFVYFSYILIMLVSVIGNGSVCYLVLSSSRMRSVTNFFIVNLSAGDMLMTLLCVPFSFVNILILMYWPFGEIMCRVVSYWQGVSVFISAYTLVAISIDRYIAIMFPFKPRMSNSTSKIMIGAIWIFACITAFPILIVSKTFMPDDPLYSHCERYVCQEHWETEENKFYYTIVLMVLQYGVPFFALVYTYTRIAIVVWGKETPGEAENARDQRMAKKKRKVSCGEKIAK
ncbi:hypothetical protein RUM43_001014 [Polyplax serrata]|uniref:G-protein coupled receptors family 1 profile domain-containing protein n=1 Tax=Polyplax serrata TaxID=468196 RepID=A0AAN8SDB2_POLSC